MFGHSLLALTLGAPAPATEARLPADIPTAVPAPEQPAAPQESATSHGPETGAATEPATADDGAEEAEASIPGPDVKPGGKKKRGSSKVKWQPKARIMAGFRVKDATPSLFLRQARVGARARAKRLEIKATIDLADALDRDPTTKALPDTPFIRDAWANVKIHRAFQVKVGRFKRPFSRLELRGVWKNAFLGRGLFNGFAIEDRDWGDRAVGTMFWGRASGRGGDVEWSAGVSSPCPIGIGCPVPEAPGVTAGGRIEYDPVKWFSIGANGSYKHVRLVPGTGDRDPVNADVAAAGGDIRITGRGFYGAAEVSAGQDWRCRIDTECSEPGKPWMVSALAHATYTFRREKKTTIGPVLIGEFMDADLRFARSEAIRAAAGIDIRWGKHLRILPQVDVIQPIQDPPRIDDKKGYHGFMESSVTGLLMLGVQL